MYPGHPDIWILSMILSDLLFVVIAMLGQIPACLLIRTPTLDVILDSVQSMLLTMNPCVLASLANTATRKLCSAFEILKI